MKYALAIDQGTSGSKAIIFDETGEIIVKNTVEVASQYFNEGFVEQNPTDILSSVQKAVSNAVEQFSSKGLSKDDIVTTGISNQRESFLLWNSKGEPVCNIIVWQCKRSISICNDLKEKKLNNKIFEITGLPIDPYFSGTKLRWLMEKTDLYERSKNEPIFFGTIDTWLLYNLTEGQEYKTDYTNASRTMLFNLNNLKWDEDMKYLLKAEYLQFPKILPSSSEFGLTDFNGIFQKQISIGAMIGDSHAASFGEGCFNVGSVKATMGTGSSVMMNTGTKRVISKSGMVSTICWSTPDRIDYALEGVIVSCGSTITWACKQLNIVNNEKELDTLAEKIASTEGVVFIPAFSGLGGPHWQMDRKAEIRGITFGTQKEHIAKAILESYPFQLKDVIQAMEIDIGKKLKELKADGGLTNSKISMKWISALLSTTVTIDRRKEASALGAGFLAFLNNKVLTFEKIQELIEKATQEKVFENNTDILTYINKNYKKWTKIVQSY